MRWFEELAQDTRCGLRGLRKAPPLVITAALSLGLAVGPNAMIFGSFQAACLEKVTAEAPDQLVKIKFGPMVQVSYPNWQDLQGSGAFSSLAGYIPTSLDWNMPGLSDQLESMQVTSNFFDTLRTKAKMGRLFSADEAKVELQPRVLVLGYSFWQRLGSDPGIIGHSYIIDSQPFIVIGVLPRNFHSVVGATYEADIYMPVSRALIPKLYDRDQQSFNLFGRLRNTSAENEARGKLAVAVNYLKQSYPRENRYLGSPRLVPISGFRQLLAEDSNSLGLFLVLFGMTGLVLLIACANVSNLLLARAASRDREFAVRAALGASLKRLLRQLLTESLLLSLLGAIVGLCVSLTGARALLGAALPVPIPFSAFDLGSIWQLLEYMLSVVAVVTVLCGIMPIIHAKRVDLIPSLNQTASGGHKRRRLFRIFVVVQVTASFVLLAAALVFVRNLSILLRVDTGLDINEILYVRIGLGRNKNIGEGHFMFLHTTLERVRHVPSVVSASCSSSVPLNGNFENGITVRTMEGEGTAGFKAVPLWVCPDYFATMRIPVHFGREFNSTDVVGAGRVAVVNETLARRYFVGRDPAGRSLVVGDPGGKSQIVEIVGVVRDFKIATLDEPASSAVVLPYLQGGPPLGALNVLLRTRVEPSFAAKDVHDSLQSLDGSALVEVKPLSDNLDSILWQHRFATFSLATLALFALLLAIGGLYGVISYSVARRLNEIGVRMCLGASRVQICRVILLDALRMIGMGIVLGLIATLVSRGLWESFVPGTGHTVDPFSLAVVGVLLCVVGLVAAFGPARRAMRTDPSKCLRSE